MKFEVSKITAFQGRDETQFGRHILKAITMLGIIHRPVFDLKCKVSETAESNRQTLSLLRIPGSHTSAAMWSRERETEINPIY
jgi:hypothetical protein